MSVVLPLVLMALFAYVFGGAIATGTRCIDYVVSGGVVDRLRSLPIRSSAVLVGHVTASVARASRRRTR